MTKRILLFTYAIGATIVVIIGFAFFWQSLVEQDSAKIIFVDGKPIHVTVVDTPETRAQGLSGREGLPKGEGMLFVFPEDGEYGFWMKDMRFSIDIVWLAADGIVLHIEENVSPQTYPSVFRPNAPARYVLELPAGSAKEYTINPSSRIDF